MEHSVCYKIAMAARSKLVRIVSREEEEEEAKILSQDRTACSM